MARLNRWRRQILQDAEFQEFTSSAFSKKEEIQPPVSGLDFISELERLADAFALCISEFLRSRPPRRQGGGLELKNPKMLQIRTMEVSFCLPTRWTMDLSSNVNSDAINVAAWPGAHLVTSPPRPREALCGGIPCPFLEPSACYWSHFVGNC